MGAAGAADRSVAPGRMGGHRRPILEPHWELILARLKERPETTLVEMRGLLAAERGCRWTRSGGSCAPGGRRMKNGLLASETERPDLARRRARWRRHQARIDPRRLVFVDETWTRTNMGAARAAGGRRARGSFWECQIFCV